MYTNIKKKKKSFGLSIKKLFGILFLQKSPESGFGSSVTWVGKPTRFWGVDR